MKNNVSGGGWFHVTPPSVFGDLFRKTAPDKTTAYRNRDGERCRYFHSCPAYFPLLKKIRGGYRGGSGRPRNPGVC